MSLHLYNTLTRQKEKFVPLAPPRVTCYNCGPTVYDAFTIGNARNFIFADVLRRWLRSSGYEVKFAQNLTDVDDKVIKKANEEGRSAEEVARHYAKVYFEHADALGIERADIHPLCTEHIPQMVDAIAKLVASGHAYASEGDVFFDVSSYKGYGRLSRKKLDDMEQGERVGENILGRKRNHADFALWKGAKPGEPSWDSPWGPGRPGWHIECSVMSMMHLGETIDIHSGGEDLQFPHHENEIAQSCCLTGKEFVRYWLHNAFLNFGDKISKSTMTAETRAIFMIDKALARFKPEAIRYFLLTAHYRSPLQFSLEGMEEAEARVSKIRQSCEAARQLAQDEETLSNDASATVAAGLLAKRFQEAMDDDINTPQAFAAIADAIGQMNALRADIDKARAEGRHSSGMIELMQIYQCVGDFLDVLGLKSFLFDPPKRSADRARGEAIVQAMIAARVKARSRKQFAFSDAARDALAKHGIAIKDGASGATWSLAEGSAEFPDFDKLLAVAREAASIAKDDTRRELDEALAKI